MVGTERVSDEASHSHTIIRNNTIIWNDAIITFLRSVFKKTKLDAGQSSLNMLNVVKEIEYSGDQGPKGKRVTDPIEKSNSLNSYYAPLFSSERNNPLNSISRIR